MGAPKSTVPHAGCGPASIVLSASMAMGFQGPLRVHPTNPRYFTDDSGRAILLVGAHTWQNFLDSGNAYPPPVFDYTAYLDFIDQTDHNFFRFWVWEQARWTVQVVDDDAWFDPLPYQRTGPGTALDGRLKFDLTQFNQAYFDRMRARIIEAGNRGMYASIMLFDGWSPYSAKGSFQNNNPWKGHPYNSSNNINGIDGDIDNDQSGEETHLLADASVTRTQEAYLRKVIDTVNDLDNILYEVSNESDGCGSDDATQWQYHIIQFVKNYEATKPKQHPVGMTVEWPCGDNTELYDSPADWISPNNDFSGATADGSKVIVTDSDHIWGIGGDRYWVWRSFCRGTNILFMDGYDGTARVCGGSFLDNWNMNDPTWVSLRENLGFVRHYANQMNLAGMTPQNSLSSTQYCLAEIGKEYLVYQPNGGSFTVNLTAASGPFAVEWLNPENGSTIPGPDVSGGSNRGFTPPFSGDAVLYLRSRAIGIVVGLGSTQGAGWAEVIGPSLANDSWLRVPWTAYNSAVGETRPAFCNLDSDVSQELVLGLGSYPGAGTGGYVEIKDDAESAYAHLAWLRVGFPSYNAVNGETFPACGDLDETAGTRWSLDSETLEEAGSRRSRMPGRASRPWQVRRSRGVGSARAGPRTTPAEARSTLRWATWTGIFEKS